MQYNFGDKVDGSKDYSLCPECGRPRVGGIAKRPQLDSEDDQGHKWHIDVLTMTVKKGHPE